MLSKNPDRRTLQQNLTVASLFAAVAGLVNVVGFLSIHTLTTHVTGHVAFLAEALFLHEWKKSVSLFLFIFFFWLGAFVSGLLVETASPKNAKFIYKLPVLLEALLLLFLSLAPLVSFRFGPTVTACVLLFAMGIQNATVTQLSNALIRTTHLTGLFTDLAIELAQLLLQKEHPEKNALKNRIYLRIEIVAFFVIGGIAGGILYPTAGQYSLALPALLLVVTLSFNYRQFRQLFQRRRI